MGHVCSQSAVEIMDRQAFSVNRKITNILACVGHMIFVITTHLCSGNVRAALDSMYMTGCGCVPPKVSTEPGSRPAHWCAEP